MRNVVRFASIVGISMFSGVALAAGTPAAPSANVAFLHDLAGAIGYNGKHVLELEDAVPQKKFSWRPDAGVRSIAEAYLHIAFGNYALLKIALGKDPPAAAGFEMNPAKWDKKTTDKAEIKKILEQSFAFVQETLEAAHTADLDKKVDFFGNQVSSRTVLIALANHVSEHMGQEVAYARANKITPPWSKAEKAAEDKKMAEEKKGAMH